MTVKDALAEATREGHTIHYARETSAAIAIVGDIFPYLTEEEMCREHQGLCRDIAIHTIGLAYRLQPGVYFLMVGDSDQDPERIPDHAWVEALDSETGIWWSDPTNGDEIHKPQWYTRLTAQRSYRYAVVDGRGAFVERADAPGATA